MAKTTTYKTIEGLNKALRSLPKEAADRLRGASKVIAVKVAGDAASKARSQGGVAALVAPSIRGTRDRVPKVLMGSAKRLPTAGNGWARARSGPGQTVGNIIWGAEFGGGARPATTQFLPFRGNTGYFLWPTVREDDRMIQQEYSDALLDALKAIR